VTAFCVSLLTIISSTVVHLCETWRSCPKCRRLHSRKSASPTRTSQNLVGFTIVYGMDPIGLRSGRVRTQNPGGNRRL